MPFPSYSAYLRYVGEPAAPVHTGAVQGRVPALQDPLVQRADAARWKLVPGQRQQVQVGDAARETLGNVFLKQEMVGAREYEAAHARVLVQDPLQIGEQLRHALRFIQHGTFGKLGQEASWIAHGPSARIRIFQTRVRLFRKNRPNQCGFTGLTRPDHGNGLELPDQQQKFRTCFTLDHGANSQFRN